LFFRIFHKQALLNFDHIDFLFQNIDKKLSINPKHFLAQRRQGRDFQKVKNYSSDAKKINFYSKTFAALRLGARTILLPS